MDLSIFIAISFCDIFRIAFDGWSCFLHWTFATAVLVRACPCVTKYVSGSLIPQQNENKSIERERKIRNILYCNDFAILSCFANIS